MASLFHTEAYKKHVEATKKAVESLRQRQFSWEEMKAQADRLREASYQQDTKD